MATQPDDLQGQEQIEEGALPPEGESHEEQQEEQQQEVAPPTLEEVARQTGWVPQDEYKGDASKWRPAHEFILHGRDIQQRVSSELREVKQTLDTVVKTSAQIAADRLESQKRELSAKFQTAVDDGDPKAAYEASQQLGQIDQRLKETSAPPAPPQDVQAFATKNAGWFNVDPAATALAIGMSNKLSHLPVAEQLQHAEQEVRRVYPHLFADSPAPQTSQPKPQAQTRQPTSRTAAPPARAKGFADMPPAAQKVAKDMADRGVIPNAEAYASGYWNMVEGNGNG